MMREKHNYKTQDVLGEEIYKHQQNMQEKLMKIMTVEETCGNLKTN